MDLVVKLFDLALGRGKSSGREKIEAIKVLLSYGFGLPSAHVELSAHVETQEVPLERMTTGELRQRLSSLEAKRTEREKAQ